jgi:hypothetical protein
MSSLNEIRSNRSLLSEARVARKPPRAHSAALDHNNTMTMSALAFIVLVTLPGTADCTSVQVSPAPPPPQRSRAVLSPMPSQLLFSLRSSRFAAPTPSSAPHARRQRDGLPPRGGRRPAPE